MLTQKMLKELLHYDPETGVFTRRVRTCNSIHVGDVAGTQKSNGYMQIGICGVYYLAGRLAWLYMKGVWPVGIIIHKDTAPSNSRWENLIEAMTSRQPLTQKLLKELLHYNPTTGVFTRLAPSTRNKIGDIAGTLDQGYVRIRVCGITYRAHRLAWFYMTGRWPDPEVDHKDTDQSNNRWKNLREATHSINMQNKRKAHINNQTGFLGVSQRGKGFRADIGLDDEKRYLGTHQTPELAYAEYLAAKRKIHQGCTI